MNNTMITRGSLIAISLTALTLGVITGSSMSSQTNALDKSISDANTFGRSVNLEVVREGLGLRVTGRDTMEALTSLIQIENFLETQRSKEKSSPYTPGSEM